MQISMVNTELYIYIYIYIYVMIWKEFSMVPDFFYIYQTRLLLEWFTDSGFNCDKL